MKNILISVLIFMLAILGLTSCQEPIDVTLDKGTPQLGVDALVMFDDGPQSIRLTVTGGYFDQNKAQGASGATVQLTSDLGQSYSFTEDPMDPGTYKTSTLTGVVGEKFTLQIDYKGETFKASSIRMRGTEMDTLHPELRERQFGQDAGWYANMNARDSVGFGDFYWIRMKLNGVPDRRTNRLNSSISADGAFDIGSADGLDFIYPIRNSINLGEPYLTNDTLEVELLSIDYENWRFLREMQGQLENTGLFARPIANVRGNVENINPNSTTKAVGSFGVARVSRGKIVFP